MARPRVHSEFNVTSGCLCYGDLHNVWHGASSPIRDFPTTIGRHIGGTVTAQILDFNTVAKNGIWKTFQLVEKGTGRLCAWFASHSDVDPEVEIDKILRVSGSPYERDSGSRFNDEKTAAEAVLVINRYDWGYYDKRGKEEIGVNDEVDIDNLTTLVFGEGLGLVDLGSAKTEVLQWKEESPHERGNPSGGAWMFIPGSECMFGRFGFDEARTAARSFLFFTMNTYFSRTGFVGLDRTIRLEESDEEWFQRCLREGRTFEGLDTLEHQIAQCEWSSLLPAESEYLGPYDSHEHLLKSTDIDAIRIRPGVKAPEFAEPLKELSHACLNEMIMSYLEHFIAPASSYDTIIAAANSLFPKNSTISFVDGCMYSFMMEPYSDPISGYDNRTVGSKVKSFLAPRCEDNSLVRDHKFIAGICSCIAFLLSEVLELAKNGTSRSVLVPGDIRIAVFNDEELRGLFKYSRVFWKGNSHASQIVGSSHTTEPAQAVD